ncbi:hypothetical protein LE181_00695 [Streptomyces sp. SCA3-4]|uniref:hypothetical protein n=1 Tax=Streptomyces sichuanensis TaxID=2871810 RepID=UPI001CE2E932|nr:hypothetical protein [Streptomyces sichuanensis]MCA6090700.1 hypothetical protein [Streptomyces sichuanensis]
MIIVVVMMLGQGESGGPAKDPAEAQKLASDVAATPEDWGPGFTNTGEQVIGQEEQIAQDCSVVTKANRAGTIVALQRDAENKASSFSVRSEVRVFEKKSAAESLVKESEDGNHRCPNQRSSDGQTRWEQIREGSTDGLTGFDDVFAEEGIVVTADDSGSETKMRYVLTMGNVDDVTLNAQAWAPGNTEADARNLTKKAMQAMQKRLAEKQNALPRKR